MQALKTAIGMILAAVAGFCLVGWLFALAGCFSEVIEPEDIVQPDDLAEIAEAYCAAHPELTCGHVWDCTNTVNPDAPPVVEQCILDDHPVQWAETAWGGACTPAADARFNGHPLCWWCCGEGCGAGCNAFEGCFCP